MRERALISALKAIVDNPGSELLIRQKVFQKLEQRKNNKLIQMNPDYESYREGGITKYRKI